MGDVPLKNVKLASQPPNLEKIWAKHAWISTHSLT